MDIVASLACLYCSSGCKGEPVASAIAFQPPLPSYDMVPLSQSSSNETCETGYFASNNDLGQGQDKDKNETDEGEQNRLDTSLSLTSQTSQTEMGIKDALTAAGSEKIKPEKDYRKMGKEMMQHVLKERIRKYPRNGKNAPANDTHLFQEYVPATHIGTVPAPSPAAAPEENKVKDGNNDKGDKDEKKGDQDGRNSGVGVNDMNASKGEKTALSPLLPARVRPVRVREMEFVPDAESWGLRLPTSVTLNMRSFLVLSANETHVPVCVIQHPPEDGVVYTMILSHGNAVDLGKMMPFHDFLYHQCNVNVVAYDYTGYGASLGYAEVPSESQCYDDIETVYDFACGYADAEKGPLVPVGAAAGDSFILYGQSVGSGSVMYIASGGHQPSCAYACCCGSHDPAGTGNGNGSPSMNRQTVIPIDTDAEIGVVSAPQESQRMAREGEIPSADDAEVIESAAASGDGAITSSGSSCCGSSRNVIPLERPVAGMILHSPISSGVRVITGPRRWCLAACDLFPNVSLAKDVRCKTLLIHGEKDKEVSVWNGEVLQAGIPEQWQTQPWYVPNRGHNDTMQGNIKEFSDRLNGFLKLLRS